MTKLLIACAVLLTGCDLSDMAEKKCIDGRIYHREGSMWVKSFRDHHCEPITEGK